MLKNQKPTPRAIKAAIDPAVFYARELPNHVVLKADHGGWSKNLRCPFHEDSTGSFGVHLRTGAFKCFGCGQSGGSVIDFLMTRDGLSLDQARSALSEQYPHVNQSPSQSSSQSFRPENIQAPTPTITQLKIREVPPPPVAHPTLGCPTATWRYLDAEGHLLAVIARFETAHGKEIRPLHWAGGVWKWAGLPAPRPLYNLLELTVRPDAVVVVCEGEKAADAAARMLPEVVTTTSMNGAQAADKTDWSPLKGRAVVIWPDADVPGAGYAERVQACVREAGARSVRVMVLAAFAQALGCAELPLGWDAADALAAISEHPPLAKVLNDVHDVHDVHDVASAEGGPSVKSAEKAKGSGKKGKNAPHEHCATHESTSIADELVAFVQREGELFHAPDGMPFVTIPCADSVVRKTFKLDTRAFDEFLSYSFYTKTKRESKRGRAASETAIRTAKATLVGIAQHEGGEKPIYLRAAPWQDGYILDLGTDDWRVVEVRPGGWRILEVSPVKFWRPNHLRALPIPTVNGDLERLWDFANIPVQERPLVLAFLLDALRPETPFPILELIGPQGSAKSSTQDKLRRLIDPNTVTLRSALKTTEDLFISAGCNWLVSLNNLSHLSAQQQDALCNLATGGGFSARTLYTNADETLIETKRPVMLNGIVPLVTAQDLTDRVLHIELEALPEYREEAEIEAAFTRAAPGILGGLLDLFAATLARLPDVKPKHLPRMGDFARLGEAMYQVQGYGAGAFIAAYNDNRKQSVTRALDASPVSSAIREFADESRVATIFNGTMKSLLATLEKYRTNTDAWPKSPRGLGDAIRRQLPALRTVGLEVAITAPKMDGVHVIIHRPTVAERHERHLKLCQGSGVRDEVVF